jgi:flagellar assembly protein FliH
MSSSAPSMPAPDRAGSSVQPFPYAAVSSCEIARQNPPFNVSPEAAAARDTGAREAQALAQGRQEGEAEARRHFEEQLARERAAVAAGLGQFALDRKHYFHDVEAQIVQLALSMARKILHREAQVDPLLLAGIVRVALEQIDGATRVRLRVHPQNSAEWTRYLATQLQASDFPEIVEDASQSPTECTLETSMGAAKISVEAQLKEIEQGLMDLLATRPGTSQ